MKTLRVNLPDREYDIKIENGIIDRSGELIAQIHEPCNIAIVTDSNVAPLYSNRIITSLKKYGFTPQLITIPPGESSKSVNMLTSLYTQMLSMGLTRSDLIIALGGGVVGDLTGFCASTLLRGIPFVQIPTTLLAQVDSSVGGKVAVNLPQGKNLVGTFYQPKLVIIDPLCLETLSDRIFSDGMAEVIKYGVILDEALFSTLRNSPTRTEITKSIDNIIYRSCDLKRMVVEEDECDTGGRMILNFGHTFGHAIEKKYNFTDYTHGEGVAAGMVMAAEYGEHTGVSPHGTAQQISEVVAAFGLPAKIAIDKNSLMNAVKLDKKGEGNLVTLVLPQRIGKAILHKTKKDGIWIW